MLGFKQLAILSLISTLSGCYLSHELEEPGEDVPPGNGNPVDVPPGEDPGEPPPDPFPPGPPPPSDCPAALLAGAPVPMPGYCPTRANRSAFTTPEVPPELRWTLALPVDGARTSPIIVGPGGRLYITAESWLFAIDDRGDEALITWELSFDGRLFPPVLLADGTVFVVRREGSEREGIWLSTEGEIVRRRTLPDGVETPLVGSAGTLFFLESASFDDPHVLHALDRDGNPLWSRELADRARDWAVGENDRIAVYLRLSTDDLSAYREGYYRAEAWVEMLDGATGDSLWQTVLDTDTIGMVGPAFGPDGSVYVVLRTNAHSQVTLVVLEPDGAERFRYDFPVHPEGTRGLSVSRDGTAVIANRETIAAIDRDGVPLWETENRGSRLAGVIDAKDRYVVSFDVLDMNDGSRFWENEIPAHTEERQDGGWSASFGEEPYVGDGVIYYMAADRVMFSGGAL